jgi:hypothetical protein
MPRTSFAAGTVVGLLALSGLLLCACGTPVSRQQAPAAEKPASTPDSQAAVPDSQAAASGKQAAVSSKQTGASGKQMATPGKQAAAASGAASQEPGRPKPVTQTEPNIILRDNSNYADYLAMSKANAVVPGLTEGYVPQGIAYDAAHDWMLISYYRKGGDPGLISAVDMKSGKLVKSVQLFTSPTAPYTGHAGGIAASKAHGWIASQDAIYPFNLQDIERAEDMGKLVLSAPVKTESRADYMTTDNGVLWVGEYAGFSYPVKDATHHMQSRDQEKYTAWVSGYSLTADDSLDTSRVFATSGAIIPDRILSVPDDVQGMAIGQGHVVLSTSNGKGDSHLFVYKLDLNDSPHATTAKFGSPAVPVWFLDGHDLLRDVMAPPMAEGMFVHDGSLYTLFESGAAEYRGSVPYALDKVYATDTAALFGGAGAGAAK